jgi:hypothetical protein
MPMTVVHAAADLTVTSGNTMVIVTVSGVTITLPSAALCTGQEVVVIPADGVTGIAVSRGGSDTLCADGTNRSNPFAQDNGTAHYFSDGAATWYFTLN